MKTNSNATSLYIAVSLLAAGLLAGCSGIKTYPNTLAKNLHVRTETDSAFFSKVRVDVDVYRVAADCKIEYEGTVKLNEPLIDIGIPSDRTSYLVFNFNSSSFLAGSRSSIDYDTLLKPRGGFDYNVKLSYKDDIYNVVIMEKNRSKSSSSEIERKDLNKCKTN